MRAKDYLKLLKNRPSSLIGITIIASFALIALLAPLLAPPTSDDPYLVPYHGPPWIIPGVAPPLPTFPNSTYPFGTLAGYDLYYACIWGVRTAFYASILTTFIAVAVGTCIGSIAGYFGGVMDEILMRFTDAFFAIPGMIYVLLVVIAMPLTWQFSLGIINLTITLSKIDRITLALAIVGWPSYARLIRGEIQKIKNQDFVEASKASGCSSLRILTGHVLPNSMNPTLALAFLNMGGVVLAVATLGFLGVAFATADIGIGFGYAEWGAMIGSTFDYLSYATNAAEAQFLWLLLIPATFLSFFVLGWSLIGDALTYLIDPTLRRRLYF